MQNLSGYEVEALAEEGAKLWMAWDTSMDDDHPAVQAWRAWRNENLILAYAVKAACGVAQRATLDKLDQKS